MPGGARLRRIARSTWDVTVEVVREFSRDRVMDLAAGVTFFMVFAVPAAALAFTAFLGLLAPVFGENLRDDARDAVSDFIRDEIAANEDLIETVESLFDTQGAGLFTAAVILAIYAMSRGFAGLVRALDAAYDLDDRRSWLSVRLTAVGLSIGTIVMAALALAAFVIGPAFGAGQDVADRIGLGSGFATFWDLARGPVMFLVLIGWATLIFHIGPDHQTPWRYDVPGALLTGVLWLALSVGFGIYVDLTADSNQVVGIISTALVALTWLHFTFVALLVGAELNGVLAQRAGISEQRERSDTAERLAREAYEKVRVTLQRDQDEAASDQRSPEDEEAVASTPPHRPSASDR
ncbi:MAG: YihY/virulence factor BrkB family protein [Actinomycetota bacterium]